MMNIEMKTTPAVNLSEEQIAEIKKVFAVFDKDGDASISATELGAVITNLAQGVKPSDQELQALMKKMDSNNDGVIGWDEFLQAIAVWLKEEDETKDDSSSSSSSSSKSRKRKEPPAGGPTQARAKIHKQISSFFLQFKRQTNFDEIRKKYSESKAEDNRHGSEDQGFRKDPTAQEKAAALELSQKYLPDVPLMIRGINGNDPSIATKCTNGVADVLFVCEVFQTPEERYEISDFLFTIFQRIQEAGIIPRICNFLTVEPKP